MSSKRISERSLSKCLEGSRREDKEGDYKATPFPKRKGVCCWNKVESLDEHQDKEREY